MSLTSGWNNMPCIFRSRNPLLRGSAAEIRDALSPLESLAGDSSARAMGTRLPSTRTALITSRAALLVLLARACATYGCILLLSREYRDLALTRLSRAHEFSLDVARDVARQ